MQSKMTLDLWFTAFFTGITGVSHHTGLYSVQKLEPDFMNARQAFYQLSTVSTPLLYTSCLAILCTFIQFWSLCQLHEHRLLSDLNSNFLGIFQSVWIQAVEWVDEESKARLCPNSHRFVTNPRLPRSEQGMNKTEERCWERTHIKGRMLEKQHNWLPLRQRWRPDQE